MPAAPDTHTHSPRDRRELLRRSLLQVAAVVVAFAIVDGFILGRFPWETLWIRIGWAGGVAAIALTLPVTSRGQAWGSRLVGFISIPALAAIAHQTGGIDSIIFIAFPAVPLVAVLFTEPRSASLTIVLCVVAVAVELWLQAAPWREAVAWLLLQCGLGGLGMLGARHLVRIQEVTLRAERQRALAEGAMGDALQRLATTERRAAHAERLALVGSLASGVAHEINNPLAFAKSSARFVQERFADAGDEETRQAFEDVTVGLARIEQIVRDLRNFAREDREGTCPVPVRSMVEEAVRIASVRLHGVLEVTVEVEQGLAAVETSPGRVVQVLVNLLVNAADAVEALQPRVDVSRAWVTARSREGWLELAVEDNGPGIADDVLPKLFQPFFTTKPVGKGTGLGLALSREYCARLGGTLVAEKRPGGQRGARFVVRLPRAAPERPGVTAAPDLHS